MPQRWKAALVIGASSGIGEAISRQLACEGTNLALVARREERLKEIAAHLSRQPAAGEVSIYSGDVRDVGASQHLFGQIVADMGGLDLVVYSSGIMPSGTADGYPTEEDIAAIETNFAGAVVWLNAAAEYFSKKRSGTIIGIGSVAGDRGRRANPVYNATKSALASYLESLRNRVAVKGVTVLTAKPGFVRTALIGYARTFPPAASPERAARDILDAARRRKRVAYVPGWWRWVALLLRLVPAPLMERLPV